MNIQHAALSLFAVLWVGIVPAHASVITSARDSVGTITFNDAAFRDARLVINATQTIDAASSGTEIVVVDAASSLESYALSSSSAVRATLDSFTPPSTLNVAVTASGAGSWSVVERYSVSDDLYGPGPLYRFSGRNDDFVPFTNNKLPALELQLFIGGLVDDGGTFGVGFTIPGDWSTTGGLDSTSFQYFLNYLDDEWTIDTPFVFDRSSNVTRFHATNAAYEGLSSDHPSPFLDVYFIGSVPEPEGWMMFAGFGAVGFVMRRRRASRITASASRT